MSKYFISVYKNYLNRIESDKSIEDKCKTLINKMTLFNTSLNNYSNYIDNCGWKESGKSTITSNFLPRIRESSNILTNSVMNNLSRVISLIKDDLYNLLVELKEKDDDYCLLQDKLKVEQKESEIDYIKEELKVRDAILVNLVKKIDNKILEIKSYNDLNVSSDDIVSAVGDPDLSSVKNDLLKLYMKGHKEIKEGGIIGKLKYQIEEERINKLLNGDLSYSDYLSGDSSESSDLDNSNCVDLSLLNENWKVINTPQALSEYVTEAYNKGIRQNSNPEKYGDYCLAFSYVHASNLHKGEVDPGAESAYKWNHASEFYDYFSDSKQETLKTVYNQIKEGNPVVMQVNGNSKGTTRHFVTVVGINANVKNADSVQESDLLILDSWDGKLEKMGTTGSRFMTTGKDTNKSYSGYYLRILK